MCIRDRTVGLGCEYTQPSWLDEIARNAGKAHAWLLIQTEGGTLPSVRKGLSLIREMLPALSSVCLLYTSRCV